MNRKQKFAVGSLLIVTAVVALIYTAASETSTYYLTMDEYSAGAHEGQPLRLAGRVTDGSIDWNPRTLDLAFEMGSIPPGEAAEAIEVVSEAPINTQTLRVEYNGILPDMFGEGRDVIVEGLVENQVLHADTLLTTCPSKYEAGIEPDEGDVVDGQLVQG